MTNHILNTPSSCDNCYQLWHCFQLGSLHQFFSRALKKADAPKGMLSPRRVPDTRRRGTSGPEHQELWFESRLAAPPRGGETRWFILGSQPCLSCVAFAKRSACAQKHTAESPRDGGASLLRTQAAFTASPRRHSTCASATSCPADLSPKFPPQPAEPAQQHLSRHVPLT